MQYIPHKWDGKELFSCRVILNLTVSAWLCDHICVHTCVCANIPASVHVTSVQQTQLDDFATGGDLNCGRKNKETKYLCVHV